MKTRRECSFFIDNSNIVVITVVLKTDHTSEKWERTPLERSIFKIQAADTDLCSLLSRNPRNAYSLLLGLSRDKSLKRFLGFS